MLLNTVPVVTLPSELDQQTLVTRDVSPLAVALQCVAAVVLLHLLAAVVAKLAEKPFSLPDPRRASARQAAPPTFSAAPRWEAVMVAYRKFAVVPFPAAAAATAAAPS